MCLPYDQDRLERLGYFQLISMSALTVQNQKMIEQFCVSWTPNEGLLMSS